VIIRLLHLVHLLVTNELIPVRNLMCVIILVVIIRLLKIVTLLVTSELIPVRNLMCVIILVVIIRLLVRLHLLNKSDGDMRFLNESHAVV
jgi:hypothetical protein